MSVIHYFNGTKTDFHWEDVSVRSYSDPFEGVTKQVPIGPAENSNNFHVRYFRLEPGKKTNKEFHAHEHGVIIMHGNARVQINESFYELQPNDSIFISSNDLHQFTAMGDEPLGFICIVVAH